MLMEYLTGLVSTRRRKIVSRPSAAGQVVKRRCPKNMAQAPLNWCGAFWADPHSGADLYSRQTNKQTNFKHLVRLIQNFIRYTSDLYSTANKHDQPLQPICKPLKHWLVCPNLLTQPEFNLLGEVGGEVSLPSTPASPSKKVFPVAIKIDSALKALST